MQAFTPGKLTSLRRTPSYSVELIKEFQFYSTRTFSLNKNAKLFRRYVDNIFFIIKKKDFETILTEINSLHGNPKFTCEVESYEWEIVFLDIRLKRIGTKVDSQWYTKS